MINHINVYTQLLNIPNYRTPNNVLLFIDFLEKNAYIVDKSLEYCKELWFDIDSVKTNTVQEVDNIMRRVVKRINMSTTADIIPICLFIDTRNDIVKAIELAKKRANDKLEEFRKTKNRELHNKAFYGSFIGEKIGKIEASKLGVYLKHFKELRHDRVVELHRIVKIHKYFIKHGTMPSFYDMEYQSSVGLGYFYEVDHVTYPIKYQGDNAFMLPLENINMDYTRYKIHVLEVELCYINSNIRTIAEELRRRNNARWKVPKIE